MSVRLVTLGAPGCFVNDVDLAELPAQKTRFALLVYLAVERNVSRDDAAALFWAESGEERARHALSQAIYELKRALGDGWLETTSGRLAVTKELTADAHELAELCDSKEYARAAELYRGAFLSGFFLSGCKGFETWVDKQRAHVERLHRKARRESVNALVEANQLADAIVAARRWAELDPLEDEANHRLIELVASGGSRAEALRLYGAYEQRLREELDVAPLEETQQLVVQLRGKNDQPVASDSVAPTRVSITPLSIRTSNTKVVAIGLFALGVLIAGLALRRRDVVPASLLQKLDSTHFAVFPFEYAANVRDRLNEDQLIQDALGQWGGVTVVPQFQVREALARKSAFLKREEALRAAYEVGAGRYIRGQVTRFNDSLRIYGELYDARSGGAAVADRTVKVPVSLVRLDEAMIELANSLLFPREQRSPNTGQPVATHSWPARRAFDQAQNAIRDWNLLRADSQLTLAVRNDPEFTQGYLWLAQVRSWLSEPVTAWRYAAQHAQTGVATLSQHDRTLAEALTALARGAMGEACSRYENLARIDEHDFAAWYGWADCLRKDKRVLPDGRSPTGFYFAASYERILNAYEHALIIMPSLHRALRDNGYQSVRDILITDVTHIRGGRTIEDQEVFVAHPTWDHDTVAFFPMPVARMREAWRWAQERGALNAIHRGRETFLSVARAWSAAYPEDADAKQAVAVALELLGDNTALDSLIAARRLAAEPEERDRIAASEVWLHLKYGLPNNDAQLRWAAALADSVLRGRSTDGGELTQELVALSLLRGRPRAAAKYLALARPQSQTDLASSRATYASTLLAYAAIGAPRQALDSLLANAAVFRSADADTAGWRMWYERAASLALPLYRFPVTGPAQMSLLAAELAATRGDTAAVREWAAKLAELRVGISPGDLTLDAVYLEAWTLCVALGDNAAIAWLDPVLNAIRWTPPAAFADFTRAPSLVRAMGLRAELANRNADPQQASKWAAAVAILWSDPDPELRSMTRRMKTIAARRRS